MTQDETQQSNERRYYDALKRIAKAYQSSDRIAAMAEKQYGLEPREALEMAYDNIQGEAEVALRGKRRPK